MIHSGHKRICLLVTFAATTLAFAKPFPTGIVNLATGQITSQNTLGNLADHPWTSRNVRGMRFRTQWNYIQPLESSYNWTGIDEALRLGSENGKFVGISVTAGTSTPGWVYGAGARTYALQDGSGLSMPLPWDATFLSKWVGFVRALGQRYDGNPALGYVVISGLGQANETYLAKTTADAAALTSLGGTPSWVVAAKTIISAYADAFPNTPFFITMARPFPNTNPGVLALQEVVNWGVAAYPGRFGLMNASLNAASSLGYYPNQAMFDFRAQQPTGFQMLCAASDSARLRGTLGQALTRGAQIGARFIEVYEPDVNDPAQQTVLAMAFATDLSKDVLLQNNTTGARAIWVMNGTHPIENVSLGTIDPSWSIVGTGDFNSDGQTDILWQNTTGQRGIWFMIGSHCNATVNFAVVDPSWNIAGAGDFNGDGKPDILWQNSITGGRGIWLMNGARPIGNVSLGTGNPSWTIQNH